MAPWNRRPGRGEEAAGDVEDRITELVNEHGAALLGYAMRLTGDRHTAEDVVQETLTRAWQRYDTLDAGKGSVRGWLLTVARNIVIDQARARSSRPREAGELNEAVTAVPAEVDHADAVVDLIAMGQLLDTLSPEHRSVLVELYYRGRTVNEAAQTLGVPVGTVKSRSYHALRALRARLDPAPAL